MDKLNLYPKLRNTWNSTDFITEISLSIPKKYQKKVEELFSQQLRNLATNEVEKRTFSIIREVN
ncbi:hypothetical protein HY500_03755 [Candidatus Woesearchaeota archaeon]|nr:hypothetical protein [Candidatus Woesearchaeota archaeon]